MSANYDLFKKEVERHQKILRRLYWGNFIIIVLAFLFGWKYGLITIGLSLYCWLWFDKGYTYWNIDEYDIGDFREALRHLRKGLIWLAIAIGIYFIFIK